MARYFLLTLAVALLCCPANSRGQVLLDEQFSGNGVDSTRFTFSSTGDESFFGRTQLNSPALSGLNGFPQVSNGTLKLRLQTYIPFGNAAGNLFLADEIRTRDVYEPTANAGVRFEIRSRFVDDAVNPLSAGLVGGMFTFGLDSQFPTVFERDEIDIELLSNFPTNGFLTNVFEDQNFSSAGNGAFHFIPNYDATQFNDYRIDVEVDGIRFFVNDVLVREELNTLAIEPQDFRLNINAPDIFFAPAFSDLLQPTAVASENEIFIFEVDSLVISEITTLVGDVNLDGTVDFLDISPFIALLSSGGFLAQADIDGNGTVDFLDISPFIALLSS